MPSTRHKQTAANAEDLAPRTARLHEVTVPAHSRIGLELRGARVRRGESVAGVAQALRIRQIHLQALEDGRFGDLPGRAYVVGFLKTYGSHLGLDGDALVERFRNESGGLDAPAELNFPEPLSAPSLPTGGLVFGALALAVVVFAGWYLLQERENVAPATTATEVASQGAASETAAGTDAATTEAAASETAAGTDAATTETAATEDGAAPAGEAVATVMEPSAYAPPEPAAIEVEPAPAASTVAETAEDEVAPPPAEDEAPAVATGEAETVAVASSAGAGDDYVPQTFGRGNADSRVKLRALGDAWVQISGPDGELLLTRILQAGDVYLIPNRPGLNLVTGNAGGLEVSVDGVPVSPLGAVGEVRRGVSLDPERLKAGTTP